jgi:hypothetical protein
MTHKTKEISLAQAAKALASILGVILKMSDDVKNARTPLDAHGRLLFMQNSIQKNGARCVPYVRVALKQPNEDSGT